MRIKFEDFEKTRLIPRVANNSKSSNFDFILWFVVAILMTVFGTNLFFPFDFKMTEREELYRYKTVRFAAGCLLAYAVFRYLCALKAAPSLAIVFYFGVFT